MVVICHRQFFCVSIGFNNTLLKYMYNNMLVVQLIKLLKEITSKFDNQKLENQY